MRGGGGCCTPPHECSGRAIIDGHTFPVPPTADPTRDDRAVMLACRAVLMRSVLQKLAVPRDSGAASLPAKKEPGATSGDPGRTGSGDRRDVLHVDQCPGAASNTNTNT